MVPPTQEMHHSGDLAHGAGEGSRVFSQGVEEVTVNDCCQQPEGDLKTPQSVCQYLGTAHNTSSVQVGQNSPLLRLHCPPQKR